MNKNQKTIHVYLMPGMAAGPEIFEYLQFPTSLFEIHWLRWKIPQKNESLESYSKRMCAEVVHQNPVLIGVSFGGLIVQEMSKFLSLKRLIIVSSVKTRFELPRRIRFARKTGTYRLLPTRLVNYMDQMERLPLGAFFKKRMQLYKRYMAVKDKTYLDWALKKMVYWNRETPIEGIVHIHGGKDIVFPIKYIDDCIVLPKATHIMIINHYRWFNKHLPGIICEGKLGGQ